MRSVTPARKDVSRSAGQPMGAGSRLLKNGAPAHAFTREDRARGGHARAEMIRRRKELRDQLGGASLKTWLRPSPNFWIERSPASVS
jgi:hypothetical protein